MNMNGGDEAMVRGNLSVLGRLDLNITEPGIILFFGKLDEGY